MGLETLGIRYTVFGRKGRVEMARFVFVGDVLSVVASRSVLVGFTLFH